METSAAIETFRQQLETRGLKPDTMNVDEVLDSLVDFYMSVRADDVDIESLGDMLGMEWGTYGKRNPAGPRFRYSLRRQLHVVGEDDGIWALELTFGCIPDPETEALGRGGKMCHSPAEADFFRAFVNGHPATTFARTRAHGFELGFNGVG